MPYDFEKLVKMASRYERQHNKLPTQLKQIFCKIIFQKLILTPQSITLAQLGKNDPFQFLQMPTRDSIESCGLQYKHIIIANDSVGSSL